MYYYLNISHIFLYPSICSSLSKSDVQIDQHCPCLHVLTIVIFSSLLSLASHEECKFHRGEISVLKLCLLMPEVPKGDISKRRNDLSLMKELETELRLVFWGWYIVVYWMAIIKSSRNYKCVIVCHKCIC